MLTMYSDIVLEHRTTFWNEGPDTCCLSSRTCPSVVNHLDVTSTLYSSFLKLFSSLLWELYWKLFGEILVKIPQCNFTDQVQSEELKETSFRSGSERAQPGQGTQRDWAGGLLQIRGLPGGLRKLGSC